MAVIAGGGGQIGRAVAARMASLDHAVVLISHRDESRSRDVVASLPGQDHSYVMASVTDSQALEQAAAQIAGRYGRCDLLVNAAGVLTPIPPADLHALTDELFDTMMIGNLRAVYATIREFSDLLKTTERSLIVNISSQSAQRASNSCVAYAASKAGVDLMTRTLARALAPRVRVVGIAPGYLERATSGVTRLETNQSLCQSQPMGRLLTGHDVADVVESLVTRMTMITGTTLLLDGGRLL